MACEKFAEDTRLAVDPEYEEILFRRLKIEVYGYTEEIIETIRDMVEVSVSSTMQEILTELYAGMFVCVRACVCVCVCVCVFTGIHIFRENQRSFWGVAVAPLARVASETKC